LREKKEFPDEMSRHMKKRIVDNKEKGRKQVALKCVLFLFSSQNFDASRLTSG
jgi:hypothetical protein